MRNNEDVQKRFSFTYSIFFFLIILISVVFASLKVQSVTCSMDTTPCSEEVAVLLTGFKGKSFFFYDFKKETSADDNPLSFEIVEIKRELPSTIHVTIKTEQPLYTLISADGSTKQAISSSGKMLPTTREIQGILVQVPDKNNMTINPIMHALISDIIVTITPEYSLEKLEYISPTEIKIYNKDLPVLIVGDPIPTYALQHLGEIMYTIDNTQLSTSSAELSIPNPSIKELDLRFTMPVLRTE